MTLTSLPAAEDELTTSLEVVQSQHTWATQFRGDAKVLSATFCELTESLGVGLEMRCRDVAQSRL